jgi:anti-sigma factor (TIGR02949 family)
MTVPELTCREVFERLGDFLDRELDPAETALVQRHLDICEECVREYRFETTVIAAIRARLEQIRAPDGLVARVSGALALERSRP